MKKFEPDNFVAGNSPLAFKHSFDQPLDFETARTLFKENQLRLRLSSRTAWYLVKNPYFKLNHINSSVIWKSYYFCLGATILSALVGFKALFLIMLLPVLVTYVLARAELSSQVGTAALTDPALYKAVLESNDWYFESKLSYQAIMDKAGPEKTAGWGQNPGLNKPGPGESITQRFWASLEKKAQEQGVPLSNQPIITKNIIIKNPIDYRTARRLNQAGHLDLYLTEQSIKNIYNYDRSLLPEGKLFQLKTPGSLAALLGLAFLWTMGFYFMLVLTVFGLRVFSMSYTYRKFHLITTGLNDEKFYNELLNRGYWKFKSDLEYEELMALAGPRPETEDRPEPAEPIETIKTRDIGRLYPATQPDENETSVQEAQQTEPLYIQVEKKPDPSDEEEEKKFMSMFLEITDLKDSRGGGLMEINSLDLERPQVAKAEDKRPAAPWSRGSSEPGGKASALTLSKEADQNSPELLEAMWLGKLFSQASIVFSENEGEGWLVTISLKQVRIASYRLERQKGVQMEYLRLEYESAAFEYQRPNGKDDRPQEPGEVVDLVLGSQNRVDQS